MTFAFDPSLADDVSLVRFHIGDVDSEGYYLDDETIQYWVTAGSVSTAVIACIRFIITQLASPNFKLDWLSVSNEKAREGFEQLLMDKAEELGVSLGVSVTATYAHPYRADSYQDPDDSVHDGSP